MTYRWNGREGRGAKKRLREQKRMEAAMRNEKFQERRLEDELDRSENEE